MRSILTVMAIESIAPQVRTVVEVNNPHHVDHFRRANADEIMVTSRIASRLLARSSLYPGLAEIVTDIVSGGEGSELYRVSCPEFIGLRRRALCRLRAEHSATLLAIGRDGTPTSTRADFRLARATTRSWWPSPWARWRRSRSSRTGVRLAVRRRPGRVPGGPAPRRAGREAPWSRAGLEEAAQRDQASTRARACRPGAAPTTPRRGRGTVRSFAHGEAAMSP